MKPERETRAEEKQKLRRLWGVFAPLLTKLAKVDDVDGESDRTRSGRNSRAVDTEGSVQLYHEGKAEAS